MESEPGGTTTAPLVALGVAVRFDCWVAVAVAVGVAGRVGMAASRWVSMGRELTSGGIVDGALSAAKAPTRSCPVHRRLL